jgi:hypothetical protein
MWLKSTSNNKCAIRCAKHRANQIFHPLSQPLLSVLTIATPSCQNLQCCTRRRTPSPHDVGEQLLHPRFRSRHRACLTLLCLVGNPLPLARRAWGSRPAITHSMYMSKPRKERSVLKQHARCLHLQPVSQSISLLQAVDRISTDQQEAGPLPGCHCHTPGPGTPSFPAGCGCSQGHPCAGIAQVCGAHKTNCRCEECPLKLYNPTT